MSNSLTKLSNRGISIDSLVTVCRYSEDGEIDACEQGYPLRLQDTFYEMAERKNTDFKLVKRVEELMMDE